MYHADENSKYRFSYQNPNIKEIYKNFLIEPGSKIAHDLLHVKYEIANDLGEIQVYK